MTTHRPPSIGLSVLKSHSTSRTLLIVAVSTPASLFFVADVTFTLPPRAKYESVQVLSWLQPV
jgi:hypothetical protein